MINEVKAYKTDSIWRVSDNLDDVIKQERDDIITKYIRYQHSEPWISDYKYSDKPKRHQEKFRTGFKDGHEDGYQEGIADAKRQFVRYYDDLMRAFKELDKKASDLKENK